MRSIYHVSSTVKETNVFNQVITELYVPRKKSYLEYKDNTYQIKWPTPDNSIDNKGFDKNHIERNGKYKMPYTIPKGTIIIRYGTEVGNFTAPKGTPFEQLSLPYKIESLPYHEYRVMVDDYTVIAEYAEQNHEYEIDGNEYISGFGVMRGKVAPAFDVQGGGVQYLHFLRIDEEVDKKYLERLR